MSGARAAADISNDHIGIGFVDISGTRGQRGDEEEELLIEVDIDGKIPEKDENEAVADIPNAPNAPNAQKPEEIPKIAEEIELVAEAEKAEKAEVQLEPLVPTVE